MFTQDFKSFRLIGLSFLVLLLAFTVVQGGLLQVAQWAERHANPYPYRSEDWLRYLLPALFEGKGKGRMFMTGPSTVRENFLYDRLGQAFPQYSPYQGGMSLGTIDDLLLSLEYIEQVYGKEALPEICIVGVSPRFVANIPSVRAFSLGLNRYSSHFKVQGGQELPRLEKKSWIEGVSSWILFMTQKQAQRIRIGVLAAIGEIVGTKSYEESLLAYQQVQQGKSFAVHPLTRMLIRSGVARLLGIEQDLKLGLEHVIPIEVSPFKYHKLKIVDRTALNQNLRNPKSWWTDVHQWNPEKDRRLVMGKFSKLLEFSNQYGIRLYVVNLPESTMSHRLYREKNYQAYVDLVQSSIGTTPFLDLRHHAPDEEFYDAEHLTFQGAQRVTSELVLFLQKQLG